MEGTGSLHGSDHFPPGFRFHPTDQELITHYLMKKITATLPPSSSIIADIDLYKFNPWELPGTNYLPAYELYTNLDFFFLYTNTQSTLILVSEKAVFGEGEWFFFSPRDRKYPNGVRPNRSAACGYWKATGTDKPILAANGSHCLGVKKALVFYTGRPPKGIKTDWVMHEYRLLDSTSAMPRKLRGTMRLDDWVLCRVRQKGSLLFENDEIPAPAPAPVAAGKSFFIKSPAPYESYQLDGRERSKVFEVSDYQLMGYLLSSASQFEIAGANADLVPGDDGGDLHVGEQQHPELVNSMLSSIKRKLSFGSLDELMMLQPGKRMYQFAAGGQLSPAAES
ncbi:NAC transcription factor 25 [Platanthera zijinensis]|uniref:NAC transcription factor 25 n=1 Tax=Platanthera zijinensis TaxID=2320716 RepID=A0AAP0AT65_9ASPA